MATLPTLERFVALAENAAVVPVVEELVADDLTPVRAFAAVGDGPGSFLLESVVGGEKWARYSFVGAEAPVRLRGRGDRYVRTEDGVATEHAGDGFEEGLRDELAAWKPPPPDALDELGLPRFWGGAVGYVSYDVVRRFEPTVGAPRGDAEELHFAFGGALLIFDGLRQTLRIVVPQRIAGRTAAAAYGEAKARIAALRQRLASPPSLPPLAMPNPALREALPPSSFARADFEAAVRTSQAHIVEGDIFQVVLSQRFRVPAEGARAFDVYRALRVVNPSPYMYFLRLPGVEVAGASPETLVRVEDGEATLRPIAGTRPRGATDAADRAAEEDLLADPKERAEHVMLVDLGRNDLGRISAPGTVRITEKMVVERYSHVMHMTSNVRGTLAPGRDALAVLRAVFPAGTLSGAPKVRAMQIIDALEPVPRGLYGGAVGYLGFDGNADLAIAIRTVVARDGARTLQAGAGRGEAADPAKEFEETVAKARAGRVAIDAARRTAQREGAAGILDAVPRHPLAFLVLSSLLVACGDDAPSESPGLQGEALFQSPRPLVIAHRGGLRLAPEHTLLGYRTGLEAGADVLELDVARTADGEIVCIHDLTVDRTTDGSGDIRELALAEVQALDAAFRFSTDGGATFPERGRGHVIPTLRAVFEAFPDASYVIEIKQEMPSMVDDFVAALDAFGFRDRVIVAAFANATLQTFRAAAPDVATSFSEDEATEFILEGPLPGDGYVAPAGYLQLPPRAGDIQVIVPSTMLRAAAFGLPVHAFTINERDEMDRLLALGVRGLITDRPDVAREAVDAFLAAE